jgi:hypothetical protein
MTLASQLVGTWRLVSREDHTVAGERRVDPGLGADPIGHRATFRRRLDAEVERTTTAS